MSSPMTDDHDYLKELEKQFGYKRQGKIARPTKAEKEMVNAYKKLEGIFGHRSDKER